MSASPIVLVDGSSYVYRAFHALPDLRNSAGEPTGAIHGVLNMLQKLVDTYEPKRLAVVFDAPGKTFRDDLYAAYKANRPSMPDDLRSQIQPLIDAIEALGWRVLRVDGVEADDVIGTLARQAQRNGVQTIISTSDKDMTQLVDTDTTVVNTMSNSTLDVAGVIAKFGVRPDQIIDYLTLVGDTSDNIPGVAGVGPKTAVKWLEQYGDLDAIGRHIDDIGGKVGEQLKAQLNDLPLFKSLVTIKCDVDLPFNLEDLERAAPDQEALRNLFERFEMRSFLRKLEPPESQQEIDVEVRYEAVLDAASLSRWLARIRAAELVAIDTETTSLNYMQAQLVGISMATESGEAAYIPVGHVYAGAPEQLERSAVLAELRDWLESAEHAKLGHHIKYDAHIFANYDITLRGIRHDSMLESYVLDSTATRHDMDSVARRYLDMETIKYEEVAGKGAKQICFDQVDIEAATTYAAEDADVTLRIHRKLWPKLQSSSDLESVYAEIEIPLLGVLQQMERTGVLVDAEMLQQQSSELHDAMLETEAAAFAAAGGSFNLGSPKQLQEILYDRLGLPVLAKTPKGQPSTAESVLQDLADQFELPQWILRHRALAKLKSTYTDKLPREINPVTKRIHTSYHQAVAATGRLSSSEPNLQNIPIRTAEGRRIRRAFIAPPGCLLIAADYSQIELRIMAHLSEDEGLMSAFRQQTDVHRATAAEVFDVAPEAVSPDQRRSAKAINFGLIYGMSAFGLARQLGITRAEAQAYVDLYFARYPGVKRYMDQTRQLARDQGFVSTVLGRRLYLPEIKSRNAQRRQYAERSAINAPMQGTAADIIKRAMVSVSGWLADSGLKSRLIMQVHDELVLEVTEHEADSVAREVTRLMESALPLRVPLRVDLGRGANWDEAH